MVTMTTTQHLGQAPGCARHDASGVAAVAMYASVGNTTTPAGAENLWFAKRHARHLAVGST
jgi:hypothetical protein